MDMIFTFKLTEQQLTVISRALDAQPYGMVWRLIAELQRQIDEQQQQSPQTQKEAAE